ncbi:alpha/beta hydrolase [Actinoplanes sp. ATCC 53533]|uniref:alpha/beta hydrolase n=1 Tax=Actinoplanes sp. ATCC 53533 TaxID=1288362 RepID=UPI0018F5A83B|nr:alpha/beta hydrolase [Actinoplanes sp. ATCC 53533]
MAIKDRLAARMMRLVLGRLAKPSRAMLLAGADLPGPRPVTVPTADGEVRVYVYRAPDATGEPAPVYVNFHGGGFIMRHPDYDDHICRALVAETGCVVVNVDYDVAPQRPFPVAPRQALAVTEWVARDGRRQGWDGERLAVGGQSAGGNLAAGVCLAVRDRGSVAPVLQILNYPPLDLAADPSTKLARTASPLIRPSMAKVFNNAYVPDAITRTDPLASPLLARDLAGLAPALVITAEYDLLRDEADRYAARLADAGVPVSHHVMPGVDHAYTHAEPTAPLREALTLMTNALTKAWS